MKHLDLKSFKQEISDIDENGGYKNDSPVVIDFYADWCGPCKAMEPTLEQLEQENPNVKFFKINVDDNYELANAFKIKSIPALMFCPPKDLSDKRPTMSIGLKNKKMIEKEMKKTFNL